MVQLYGDNLARFTAQHFSTGKEEQSSEVGFTICYELQCEYIYTTMANTQKEGHGSVYCV